MQNNIRFDQGTICCRAGVGMASIGHDSASSERSQSSDEPKMTQEVSTINVKPADGKLYLWKPEDRENEQQKKISKVSVMDPERGGWGNKLDFLFSCISVSVGLGNVWRFPYLCYKHGGGAFVVTYMIAMIFGGIPLFYQEVALGQYLGSGGMNMVGSLCPILKGTGFATMTIVFLLDTYYCVIIAWTLFYLFSSFTELPTLPWEKCGHKWNTEHCREDYDSKMMSYLRKKNTTDTTPVEEFWEKRVLEITEGITDFGGIRWELFGLLFLGWVLVYLVIYKGLHQSGKIIWFTALFPYVILIVLLVRAVTLDGALEGMSYFITPDWGKLSSAGPWIDGSTQIFFAYSIGIGTLPALGSYNKFNHNCHRDAIITCIVNTSTCLLAGCLTFSILGYLAQIQDKTIDDVVNSGPGLVFITYPEVVLKLAGAPVWAIIFFIMLAILGVDSEFCNVESFITGVVDNWATVIRPHRMKFAFSVCFVMFLCGIPMVFRGGPYLFQLMDFYSASGLSLLWVCFFQTVAISWIFGVDRVNQCIYEMMGIKPNFFWNITWKYLTPFIMVAIFLFFCLKYEPVKYANEYDYPWWGEAIGFLVSAASMIWIPGYAIYFLIKTPGTFKERLQKGITPKFSKLQKRAAMPEEKSPPMPMSESQAVLINTP